MAALSGVTGALLAAALLHGGPVTQPDSAAAAAVGDADRAAGRHEEGVALAELSREVARLQSDLASLRRELRAQQPGRTAGVAGARLESRAPVVDPSVPDEQMIEAMEAGRQQQEERMQALDAAISAEGLDPEWAERSAERIRTALNQPDVPAAEMQHVDCRSTLCRVELGVRNVDELQELGLKLPLAVGAELPGMVMQQTEHEDGSASAVLFLHREGSDFPS